MLRLTRMSNRWLVYITVHTTCRMRLYNNRLREQGQCKQRGAWVDTLRLVVSHRSWWQICFPAVCYLFYKIQTLCVIHPVDGLPLNPLPDGSKGAHTHTHTPFNINTNIWNEKQEWYSLIQSNFIYLSLIHKGRHLLYSSCSREKMCLLKYSWSFSLA